MQNKFRYENLEKFIPETAGKYDIPVISANNAAYSEFIGFNYAKSCKDRHNKAVHFFLDDYQFARVWNRPEDYIRLLSEFSCVLSPDFSLYTDFPVAMQIYNHYSKHWLGAYWQACGITVIPTICWSDEKSFEWCFDGEPSGGTVAVSSVGTQKSSETKRAFLLGYDAMLERLSPSKIIFYGNIPEECRGNIVHIKSFQDKFREAKVYGW
jgi:hypothetical protein